MTPLEKWMSHAFMPGVDAPLCGAEPKPLPFDRVAELDIVCCPECAQLAGDELSLRSRLNDLRDAQTTRLRAAGPKARAWFRQNVHNIATASLIDQDSSPVFFDESRLLAAAYMAGAIRAAIYTHLQAGLPLTWRAIDDLIVMSELIVLAMAEGVPAA